ncbi:uncharacterized protein LOC143299231 isoform X2 [Babylonia areolata]|uniref:uncharacterized protein LOC143299231 isoform X2 n=1 Tax=Babylonia areolata TaxID=304850 RepID=UPI003FD551DE
MAKSEAKAGREKTSDDDHCRECCSLCMEMYSRERGPKILPCFHTFCLPCLAALTDAARTTERCADSQSLKAEARDLASEELSTTDTGVVGAGRGSVTEGGLGKGRPVSIVCPTCRAPATIPEEGPATLQTNFYIVTDVKDTSPTTPLPCEVCDEDAGNEATHACDECHQVMCATCRRMHDRFTNSRDHHVRLLLPRDSRQPMKQVLKRCGLHAGQEVCFFCTKCDACICRLCKLLAHKEHDTESVVTAACRARGELGEMAKVAQRQMGTMNSAVSRVARDGRDLARETEDTRDQVNARYEQVLRWLNGCREELLDSISAANEAAQSALTVEERRARDAVETLSSLVSRTADANSSDLDVIQVRHELQAALLGEDALKDFQKLADREERRTFLRVIVDCSFLDVNAVRAYLGVMAGRGDPGRVSLKQQVRELDARLKSSVDKLRQTVSKNRWELEASIERINCRIATTTTTASRDVTLGGLAAISTSTTTSAGFSFGLTPVPTATTTTSAGFSFGLTPVPTATTTTSAGFSFGLTPVPTATTTTSAGFSFGLIPGSSGATTTTTTTTGLTFGTGTTTAGKALSGFGLFGQTW